MPAGVLVDPGRLVLERPRHEVEGDRRLEDFAVVDVADRRGVAAFDEADAQHG